MKKIITSSLILTSILLAGPVHDIMDDRIKGKSYTGNQNDYEAAQDGLGIIPLNGYNIERTVANELLVQKVLTKTLKNTNDITKKLNIKENIINGSIGSSDDLNIINNLSGESSNSTPEVITGYFNYSISNADSFTGNIYTYDYQNISSNDYEYNFFDSRRTTFSLDKNSTLDFKGSTVILNNVKKSAYDGVVSFNEGTNVSNLKLKASGKKFALFLSEFRGAYQSGTATVSNCIFDFSEMDAGFIAYNNGVGINFYNSVMIISNTQSTNQYTNSGYYTGLTVYKKSDPTAQQYLDLFN